MELFNEFKNMLINSNDKIILRKLSILMMFLSAGIFVCTFDMGEDVLLKESEVNEKDN